MTIDDMARELGVSKSTISRALSGKGRIGEETRLKICNYAQEHDFIPKKSSRNHKVLTKNLGVVIPADAYSTSIPFFQDCLLGVCEAATQNDYNVLIATRTAFDFSGIQNLVENKRIDGIILTRSLEDDKAIKYLTDIKFPVGLTGMCNNNAVIQVDSDNKGASESLTSMLINKGYRKFAIILGNLSYNVNKQRYEGYKDALTKNGVPLDQQLFYAGFQNIDFLDNIINNIIANKVECIICGDDVICTMVMSMLQAEGYRIPMDISIASLYNSSNLNCFTPAITTVNIAAKSIGSTVGRQLIYCLNGEKYDPLSLQDYEILFRKSTSVL